LLLAACLSHPLVRAQLVIEITQGVDDPTPIADRALCLGGGRRAAGGYGAGGAGGLQRSGQFEPVPRADMLGFPSREQELFYRDWRAIASEYVLIGRVAASWRNLSMRYELYDVLRQARIAEGDVAGPAARRGCWRTACRTRFTKSSPAFPAPSPRG
jgi:TolB protein